MESLHEFIAKGVEQFADLLTIIRSFGGNSLQVTTQSVYAAPVCGMLTDVRSHVVLFLEHRKEDFLKSVILMTTNAFKGGEAIPYEITLISWLDTRGVVVDGIERTNTGVAEEFRLETVCRDNIRLEVAVCWAGDRDKRVAIFLV